MKRFSEIGITKAAIVAEKTASFGEMVPKLFAKGISEVLKKDPVGF